MGLEGNLKDFDLSDILQLIHMGKKTGALEVVAEAESGVIYFSNGTAVHAVVSDLSGDEAVNRILRCRAGHFAFKPDIGTSYHSIKTPLQHLVLDAARQIDEWQDIQKLIPNLDIVLAIEENPSAGTEDIKLQPSEWRVLAIVDGAKSIKGIVKDGHIGDFETCKVLYGLLSSGLLKVVPQAKPEPAPPPAPAAAEPPPVPAAPPKQEPDKKGMFGFLGKKK